MSRDIIIMGDRYTNRHGRRVSPPVFNSARASLPINLAYPEQQPHLHVVPSSSTRVIPTPRSSNSSASNGGSTVTTTYKVTTEPPKHAPGGSHLREGSRTRRSTVDNSHRPPAIVTTSRTYKPVVHSATGVRPGSPMKNPYRSSEEEYIVTPATSSRHGHHGHHDHHDHTRHYSTTMDNADMARLAREREDSRLRAVPVREPEYRRRTRPVYTGTIVRHADNISDDYGDDGYGYTNPQDLVRYDLDRSNNSSAVVHRSRRDSLDGRTARPTSMYNDIVPRSYETRERGPPPSTRGFDKIRPPPYDQGAVRMPRPPSPGNSMAPMEPVARPPPFEPVEPIRRSSSTRGRPTSYHERDRRGGSRDDYYEVRDDDRRHNRHDSYDDRVESRGFGIRTEKPESRTAARNDRPIERPDSRSAIRPERPESRSAIRPERSERVERVERSDRADDRKDHKSRDTERVERSDRNDRKEYKSRDADRVERVEKSDRADDRKDTHKGRDALATGLSLAGAALGINAVKNAARGDRDDKKDRDSDSEEREERRRRDRDYDEEPRRRREREVRDERERVDLSDRNPKERRRDEDRPQPPRDKSRDRDDSPRDRDVPPPARDSRDERDAKRETKERSPIIDLDGRDPKERQPARDDRDGDRERRDRDRHVRRSEAALSGNAIDSSDTSDDAQPRPRRENRPRGNSTAAAAAAAVGAGAAAAAVPAFNPKDTMDLKALKDALNSRDVPKSILKEPARESRQSSSKDANDAAKIRDDLKSDRGREPLANDDNRQLRVVSPPRNKTEEKPVKGILRQPKEKFPEDPAPIREGVAPLKDAKKDGVPPDARWTKISRKLVNPEALELGKERFEAREDFVIVLRVLSRDEVQGYAEVTQKVRATREELEEAEATERRRARRERHERHKRERNSEEKDSAPSERRRRRRDHHDRSPSTSDTTDYEDGGDRVSEKPKMLEAPKKRATFEDALMTGGLGGGEAVGGGGGSGGMGSLREDPGKPGVYSGYVRNPPPPKSESSR